MMGGGLARGELAMVRIAPREGRDQDVSGELVDCRWSACSRAKATIRTVATLESSKSSSLSRELLLVVLSHESGSNR